MEGGLEQLGEFYKKELLILQNRKLSKREYQLERYKLLENWYGLGLQLKETKERMKFKDNKKEWRKYYNDRKKELKRDDLLPHEQKVYKEAINLALEKLGYLINYA